MNIFDSYDNKDALMRDIESEITEETNDDGATVFRLQNKVADALKAKFEAEVKNAKSQREKKQDAEAKLQELTQLREKDLLELEELRKANPKELKVMLQRYVDETTSAKERIHALERELEPLREQNAAFKAREIREKIENELVSNAVKMNCCETALRDVKRLAPMFKLNDAGVATTDDGKLVVEVLQEEIEKSPHWLKRSQSANASPSATGVSSEAKFRDALKGSSFLDVINNAPRQKTGGNGGF